MKRPAGTVSRYTPGARANHWLNAIILILLALSGMALFHPALFFLTGLFGGGVWARILHPWMGVVLIFTFAGLFIRFCRYNIWNKTDTQWLNRIRDVLAARDENLPEVGRYNAGQKLLFLVLVIGVAGLFVSGFVIWRAYFSLYFPVSVIRLASLLHAVCAFAVIVAILIHIYAAFWVRGSVEAMVRGTVTRGWAWKHHRAWFRQITHAANPRTGPN